jgi:hypothetical protein
MTLSRLKYWARPVPSNKRATFLRWALRTGYFEPKTPPVTLVSPRGCTEYNAKIVLGRKAAQSLQNGKWHTNEELHIAGNGALFTRDSSNAVEKNIKKWRCERKDA